MALNFTPENMQKVIDKAELWNGFAHANFVDCSFLEVGKIWNFTYDVQIGLK